MGFFDRYRYRKFEGVEPDVDAGEKDEELEPLPNLTLAEFWPPSPRVKLLLIGLGFFLFNMLLLCILAWAFYINR